MNKIETTSPARRLGCGHILWQSGWPQKVDAASRRVKSGWKPLPPWFATKYGHPQRLRWAVVLTLLLPVGCQSYHGKPLTPEAVTQTLKTPSWRELRVAVKKTSSEQFPKTMLSPSQAITPERAAVLALILNPSLRAIRAAHGEASAQLLQAGILTNPVLTSSLGYVTGGFRTGTFNPYGIGVAWSIRQLIDRQARISSARYGLKEVDLEVAWREWQTAEAARLAVYAMAKAKEQLKEALAARQQLDKTYKIAQHANRLGLITLYNLGIALTASQRAKALVLTFRQHFERSQLELARAMGLGPQTVFTLSPKVRLPTAVHLPDVVKLEHKVANRRLDLLALHMGYQSQQEQLRAAVLRQFPSVSIGFTQNSDPNNVHYTSFGVSIDLPIFDRNQGQIALAKATRRALYDDYIARVFAARSDIATAAMNIRSLQRRIRQAQFAVGKYRELVNRDLQGLRIRSVNIQAYAAAMEQLERERIGLVQLQYRLARNLIALELSSGDAFFAQHGKPNKPTTTASNNSGDAQ